ncbi:hypothetical protein, unlikely [Trypanosoma brucei gambiense DAL972]|uniref:Uncharacterized protein n=1 Tax=Trypanosoma brucei gambiense (strain MHOM/CI/86/DAL972) TaxID=679716 RepID=C9ZLH6_TRYB9|nr:hypothetical protein, unlikely [Trypanosoma brucei gambiense DAL972]CBH10185.1 hypothetical protein, unlikely [Trypanosoma brucei gambiense DAL972]|eukprot:XP_011772475.1 hypothetical protein, unlikely [Trypanosoma brucei gambiense DAL972]
MGKRKSNEQTVNHKILSSSVHLVITDSKYGGHYPKHFFLIWLKILTRPETLRQGNRKYGREGKYKHEVSKRKNVTAPQICGYGKNTHSGRLQQIHYSQSGN